MASINKICIQGIRSFGPDEKDKQLLQFYSPLTLILGSNGSGKTTIIECLKYITTGDMPPNASKGGCFTHDPKLAHETEVRAQVRLQSTDVLGKEFFVTRSILATQKAKKIEQKTLEGTIVRIGDDGKKSTLNSKCADLNKEMITSLGVSKPILNNVIFCHQEDSTWPLSEGKQLKQKFDEIFAATRYIKALDTIRKLRTDLTTEKNLHNNELNYLRQHKEEAAKIRNKLQENETRLLTSKDSVKKINDKLKPLENKLVDIAEKEKEIAGVQSKIAEKRTQLKEMGKNVEHLRSNISSEFTGTMEELQNNIKDFDRQLNEKRRSIQNMEMEIKQKQREWESHCKEKNSKLLEIGQLKSQAEQNKLRIKQRDKLINTLAQQHQVEDFSSVKSDELSNFQVENFVKIMKEKLAKVDDEIKETKVNYEQKERELQNKMDELRDCKTKLEQSIKMKKEQLNSNMVEQRQVEKELRNIDASASKQKQIEADLKKAVKELDEKEDSLDVTSIKNEVDNMKQKRTELEMKFKKLDAELNRMHEKSSIQAELDVHRNDKTMKTDTVKKMVQKHEESLNHLLGHIPNENIRFEVEDVIRTLNDDIKSLSSKLQKIHISRSSAESERKILNDELKRKEEELKGYEEKIFDTCGSQNFDEGLESLQKTIKDLQDEKGALIGTRFVYNKFIEKLKKNDPCCPLCRREFDDDQDVAELIHDLNSKLNLIPNQMNSKTRLLNEQEERFKVLLQLKPLKNQMSRLNETEIPKLTSKIKNLGNQIEEKKKQASEVDEDLNMKNVDLSMAHSIQSDMVAVDQLQSELRKIEKKILSLSNNMKGGADENKTIHQITNEKNSLQRELDMLKQNLENKQERMSDHVEVVQRLKSKVNDLRTEQLNIRTQLQSYQQLTEKLSEIKSSSDECKRLIEQYKEELNPFEQKLQQKREEKEEALMCKETSLLELQNRFEEIQNSLREFIRLHDDIKKYMKEGNNDTLNKFQQQLERLDGVIQKLDNERKNLSQQKEQFQKDLSNQQVRRRELDDTLQLRSKETEMETIKKGLEELENDYGGYDVRKLLLEKRRFQKELEQLNNDRSQAEGKQRELERSIRDDRDKLKEEMYDRADEKHKNKLITAKTTEFAIADLKKYYDALDSAIMKYHMVKMEEINKIIRELWQNTYRGNDIDYIEIRTEQSETGLDKRQTYNYRVVMVKADTVMDMRGRCSAGQKVLASLIIRLALAETFCINCGIFTLDEPTTNLDNENITSLADALLQIVKSRRKQKNFQLVVITHDEDFMELLGRSEFADYYYKVGKNRRGHSEIKKCSMKSLS